MKFPTRQFFYHLPVLSAEKSRSLLLGLLILALPLPLPADTLSELPAAWQDKLQAVPETDVSGTERVAREAISRTRTQLADLLQDGTSDDTKLAEGYGELAALYQLFNIDSAAALCWENARSLQPADFRWTYYAGYLALTTGQTEKALQLLLRAGKLNPDYRPLDLRLGQLWLDADQLDKAETALKKAAGEAGLRAAALYYLGQIDLLRHNYQSAEEHLSEALRINPQASEVHYPLAQAYRHLDKQELAREHLARFKQKTPDADDPLVAELKTVLQTSHWDFRLGMQAIMEQKDYEAAIEHFRKGLEIDPDNLAARVSYARALYLGGQPDASETQLNNVLAKDPQQILANFFLAVLWESRDKPEKAAAQYELILALEPEHEGAHFYLANLLFHQGRFREAAAQYRAALAANSEIPPARMLEVVALHRAGHADSDIARELEQRVRQFPDQSELKYALIRLRSLSKDPGVQDSFQALTLANELAPKQPIPPNIEALALAAACDGQYQQAARLQQQVIDMVNWMVPAEKLQDLENTLAAYEKDSMPQQPIWPDDDPLLSPPPLNPVEPFRDYPAAVPF
ncbi:MAG: tetratricopeptide repeat protein [Thiogranum sp.]